MYYSVLYIRVKDNSGPEGIRTPRLLGANEALYQMSYGPKYTVYLVRL